MSKLRLAGSAAALVTAALLGGTLMSVVAAAPAGSGGAAASVAPAEPSPGASGAPARPGIDAEAYCAAFRAAFARNLSVTEDELVAAAKAAAASAVDAAVADGDLTSAAADRVKTKIAAADGRGCALLAGSRGKVARQAIGTARDALTAAADALGMPKAELRAQLRSGKSLRDVATTKGLDYATVSAAVSGAVMADLDAAVEAGTIRQARADRILARVERRLADGWTARR